MFRIPAVIYFIIFFVQISYGELCKSADNESGNCVQKSECPRSKTIGYCGPNNNKLCCTLTQTNLYVQKPTKVLDKRESKICVPNGMCKTYNKQLSRAERASLHKNKCKINKQNGILCAESLILKNDSNIETRMDFSSVADNSCRNNLGDAGLCVRASQCSITSITKKTHLTRKQFTYIRNNKCSKDKKNICCPKNDTISNSTAVADNSCRNNLGDAGLCVQASQCSITSTTKKTRKQFTYIRNNKCSKDKKNICCPKNYIISNSTATSVLSCKSWNGNCKPQSECLPNPIVQNVTNCKSQEVCCLNSSPTKKPVKSKEELLPKVCGIDGRKEEPSVTIASRIANGEETEIYEFTWMAILAKQIRNNTEFSSEYRCVGFLINDRYVITGAHCVYDIGKEFYFIRLGEYDFNARMDCFKGVCASDGVYDIEIEKIIMQPKYKSNLIDHDIALIRLHETASFGINIQPICLPLAENIKNHEFNGILMNIAGWGKTNQREVSFRKLKTSLLGMTNHDCKKNYPQRTFTWGQMCAGGNDKNNACRGDSGGPLMYRDLDAYNPHWVAVGISAAAPEVCGEGTQPTIFTRVSTELNFILDNLEE